MKLSKYLSIFLTLFFLASCGTETSKPIDQLSPKNAALITHCKTCHSTVEMQRGPLLEGLEGWYLEEQLEAFKEGSRGGNVADKVGQLMHSAIKDMPEEDLEFAAKWFASQPRLEVKAVIKGDIKKGEQLYKQFCFSCHEHPMGKFFSRSPDLYKTEDWYLMTQLRAYKAGWRGVDERDSQGIKMKAAIEPFSIKELQNVVAYLGQFQEKPED